MRGSIARNVLAGLLAALGVLLAKAAFAACVLGMVDNGPLLHRAAFLAEAAPAGSVRITFLGHASFLIETPEGASAVTDYNGVIEPPYVPDIVSMNDAHATHYTDTPDPRIRFVLRGWHPGGGLARNDVRWKDLHVFSVPTNIGEGGAGSNTSSVFVFEIANLCIAHLGHLHHVLSRDQLQAIGRIDVLFVPVDGSVTMTHEEAIAVIRQIQPRLVIPMHFAFAGSADRFFDLARAYWPIHSEKGSTIVIRRDTLPKSTEVRFLQGRGF